MYWAWIVPIAFWFAAIRLWIVDGPKVPLMFIAMWAAGYFGFPVLGIGTYFTIAFEALLTAILLIVERYRELT